MPSHLRSSTPRQLGLRQPAEWAPHAATWAAWPFDDDVWQGQLEAARTEFAAFMRAVARHEPVRLLVADAESEGDARARLAGADATYLRVPLDDVWMRDSGPIFVTARDGAVSCVHWAFNAWGRKFPWTLDDEVPEAITTWLDMDHFDVDVVLEGGSIETDGAGTAITTRQCLLHPQRNPSMSESDLEACLREYLGFERVVWLDRGLEGDHTDGHVDTIARFVGPGRVAACVADDGDAANCAVLRDNLRVLREAGLEVVEVPIPREARRFGGERLPLTYVNFYIVNEAVLVPQYGDVNDAVALERLTAAFPDRAVYGLASSAIITSGGSFHCLTQQQPSGPVWRAPHGQREDAR